MLSIQFLLSFAWRLTIGSFCDGHPYPRKCQTSTVTPAKPGDYLLDLSSLGTRLAEVVVDTVGGNEVANRLAWLKPAGRYVTAGAVTGAHTTLDLRMVYLNDLSLLGCTTWAEPVFARVISAIENNQIRPVLAGAYPLADLALAQQAFLAKTHFGKFAILPNTHH